MVNIAIVEEPVIKRGWLTLPSLKSQLLREDVNIAIVEEPVIKRGWLTLPSLKSC
jgi:hypothetical protein